jgi:hypothetical protein
MKHTFWEWFIIFFFIYTLFWTIDSYAAGLISVVIGSISGGVLLISYLAEWIQKSKVPKSYFSFMWASFVAPFAVGIVYVLIFAGQFNWQ